MIYQGSKNRLAKDIVPIIQAEIDRIDATCYIEPFVGGANIIDKIKCFCKVGCDINQNIITLLKYIQMHPEVGIAPAECSFEHYKDVRANQGTGKYPPEYVALIGYAASYGGRYFDGGYGRDATGKRNIYAERIKNYREQAPNLKGIDFVCMDYKQLDISQFEDAVFYLDPPYRGTKQYPRQEIDYDEFYDFCRELSKENTVFISEYWMPDDFECVWEKERKVMQKADRTTADKAVERLYKIGRSTV